MGEIRKFLHKNLARASGGAINLHSLIWGGGVGGTDLFCSGAHLSELMFFYALRPQAHVPFLNSSMHGTTYNS